MLKKQKDELGVALVHKVHIQDCSNNTAPCTSKAHNHPYINITTCWESTACSKSGAVITTILYVYFVDPLHPQHVMIFIIIITHSQNRSMTSPYRGLGDSLYADYIPCRDRLKIGARHSLCTWCVLWRQAPLIYTAEMLKTSRVGVNKQQHV